MVGHIVPVQALTSAPGNRVTWMVGIQQMRQMILVVVEVEIRKQITPL